MDFSALYDPEHHPEHQPIEQPAAHRGVQRRLQRLASAVGFDDVRLPRQRDAVGAGAELHESVELL